MRAFLILCFLPAMALSQANPAISQANPAISGTIVDVRGAAIAGAQVTLSVEGYPPDRTIRSGDDGKFLFSNVIAGSFHISVTAAGFSSTSLPGQLLDGQILNLPQIVLQVAPVTTDVEVKLTRTEIAQEQVKAEEQQRLLGVLPNYFVTYDPHPVPLTAKQKFDLALKTTYDPVTFGITGIIAGIEQARNTFPGYGQGFQGYAKRYAAGSGDALFGIMLTGAVFPAVFKQDPRYFYKGSGSTKSRILYALKRSFICQGDNGKPQFDYSGILGGLAAGGISNLYYPARDRNGAALTFENAGIGIGSTAIANLFQEFFFRKISTKASQPDPAKH